MKSYQNKKKRENKRNLRVIMREKKRITKFMHLRNEVENTIVRTIK